MGALDALGPAELRRVVTTYRDALRSHQEAINRLNVYPVPDGDTGTNMALTVESVVAELAGATADDGDLDATCRALVHGSLMGARGNSGVILSQLLRGLAEGMGAAEGVPGPKDLAAALVRADELARAAVLRPVEGTILTVARGAAGAASEAAAAGKSLLDVVEAARSGAAEALERTPDLLPVLRQAGVVDAGGSGFVLLFDALLAVVDGRALPEPPAVPSGPVAAAPAPSGGQADQEPRVADLRYEVMYLLEAEDDTIPSFKEVWAGIGDSIVVVGGGGLWNCHIHTDDVGAAVEACLDAGRPRNIRVTDLLEQVEEERWVREGAAQVDSGPPEAPLGPPPVTAVVAVASGEGVGRIFRSLGVHRVIAGGQSMNPSTAELLDAVEAVASDEVLVLPNNRNIQAVAAAVDDLTTRTVRVVPTDTIAEGFAALLAYDPEAHVDENAAAMSASARRVVPGEVTQAVRESETEAGSVRAGDWLGLSRHGIETVAPTVAEAACALLDVLVAGDHELVTLIEGDGSTAAATRRITEWLHEHRPGVEIEVHHGGQPLYPYLFSIE
jgi:DAK2 domain fusion protein YloV